MDVALEAEPSQSGASAGILDVHGEYDSAEDWEQPVGNSAQQWRQQQQASSTPTDVSGRSSQELQVPSSIGMCSHVCATQEGYIAVMYSLSILRMPLGCKADNKLNASVMLLPCLFALPALAYVTPWPFIRRHQVRLLDFTADC